MAATKTKLQRYIQRTLVITTLFVTKDFAVKSNLLLHLNLVITRSAGARQRTVLVKRTVLKRRSKKWYRLTKTVFASVCLPLIQAIIFLILLVSFIFYRRKIDSFALIKVHIKTGRKDQSFSISFWSQTARADSLNYWPKLMQLSAGVNYLTVWKEDSVQPAFLQRLFVYAYTHIYE